MSKFTPGPWKLEAVESLSVYGHEGLVLATLHGHHKTKANAALISAAPDLLEALDRAYADIIKFLNDGDFKRKVEWDAGYIVDAIKKARGES